MDSSTSAFSTIGTHHHHWQSLALFALPFLLYSTSLEFDLLGYDDSRYYLVNRALHGQGGLIAIFTSTFYSDYMPLTQLTWWIDLALFGDESWWGARLHQLVWFGAGTLSVRAIIARVTGRSDLAFAVALLFALHPVTTHSILWLAQRKSLVSFALAFWAVERYVSARTATRTRTAWKRGAVAIVLTVLATFSKAHAVAIPMLILSYELCLGQGSVRRRALALVPFVLIAGLFVTVNLLGLRADLASTVPGVSRLGVLPMDGSILLRYLLNAFLPFGVDPLPSLSFFYAVDAKPGVLGWGAWLLVISLGLLTVVFSRERQLLCWAWLFGLFALIPALNLVSQPQPMADQYLLWALPGWLCAACLIANQLLPDGAREKAGGRIRLAACSVAALLLAVVSWQRTHEYISPAALFGATIQHQPESSLAWVEYARAMRNSADDEDRLRAGSAALKALTRADAYRILDQDRPSLARESALVIHRSGEEDRALRWLDAELGRLSPAAEPVGEIERAAFYLQTGRTEKAIDLLAPSFESVPKRVVVKLRGLCKSGRTLPHELERMVRIDLSGDDADHAFNRDMILRRLQILAAAHHESGDFDSAFDVAAFMVNTEPDFLPGRLELVRTYRALGVPINDLNLRP